MEFVHRMFISFLSFSLTRNILSIAPCERKYSYNAHFSFDRNTKVMCNRMTIVRIIKIERTRNIFINCYVIVISMDLFNTLKFVITEIMVTVAVHIPVFPHNGRDLISMFAYS